jgi:ABC-2 type transport system ATP-binding protein
LTEAPEAVALALAVDGLTKRYGSVVALDDVSFALPPGTLYGLSGPNGGGKSTLLRVLATLERATSGSFRVFGHDPLAEPRAVRRLIGYAGPPVGTPELTVAEEMAAVARLGGLGRMERDESIAAMLQIVDLHHRRHRRVGELSRGDRKRLAVARALVHDPALLLLDGPFEGLDDRARAELRAVLAELADLGKTLVVAVDTLADLAGLAHEVGILTGGVLRPGTMLEASTSDTPDTPVVAEPC